MTAPEDLKFTAGLAVKRFNAISRGLWQFSEGISERLNETVDDELFALLKSAVQRNLHVIGLQLDADEFDKDEAAKIDTHGPAAATQAAKIQKEKDGTVGRMRPFDELLLWYYGLPLSEEKLTELCWRLAGGYDLLMTGGRLKRSLEGAPTWAVLRIEDCFFSSPSKKGSPQLRVRMRILSGPFSGLSFDQVSAHKFLVGVLAREIGFPQFKKVHFMELVQTCFFGLVDPTDRFPKWTEFDVIPRVLAYNQRIRKWRQECPRGYKWDCHSCSVGYGRHTTTCPKATHSRTWEQRPCGSCETNGWFDPGSPIPICLACQSRRFHRGVAVERWT